MIRFWLHLTLIFDLKGYFHTFKIIFAAGSKIVIWLNLSFCWLQLVAACGLCSLRHVVQLLIFIVYSLFCLINLSSIPIFVFISIMQYIYIIMQQ